MSGDTVLLRGGPHDGREVPRPSGGATLNIFDGPVVPGAECAKYRPGREPGVYTFRGRDRLVATLDEPKASS